MNKSLISALLYGGDANTDRPHFPHRRIAIEKLHQLHLAYPNKFTLEFVLDTWVALNARRALSLEENTNRLCLVRKVENPKLGELKETGTSIGAQGNNIYTTPTTFDLDRPEERFQPPNSGGRWSGTLIAPDGMCAKWPHPQ